MVGSIGAADAAASRCPTSTRGTCGGADYGNTVDGFAAPRSGSTTIAAAGGATRRVAATAAVFVRLPGGTGRQMGDYDTDAPTDPSRVRPPTSPTTFAGLADAGCAHVQIVVDPITRDTVELTRRCVGRVPHVHLNSQTRILPDARRTVDPF